MTEHDRLTLAPVLVENLDAIFRFDGIHMDGSLLLEESECLLDEGGMVLEDAAVPGVGENA
jgi:hypothetical protein